MSDRLIERLNYYFQNSDSGDSRPVFVASPLILDYPFIKWYLHKFGGEELFEDFTPVQRTLDLASFAAGVLNIPLARSRRMQLPPEITQGMPVFML